MAGSVMPVQCPAALPASWSCSGFASALSRRDVAIYTWCALPGYLGSLLTTGELLWGTSGCQVEMGAVLGLGGSEVAEERGKG